MNYRWCGMVRRNGPVETCPMCHSRTTYDQERRTPAVLSGLPDVSGKERPRWWAGIVMGCLGMLAFSGTLPATRVAVPVFGPTILTCSRIEIAAILGAFTLMALPGRRM